LGRTTWLSVFNFTERKREPLVRQQLGLLADERIGGNAIDERLAGYLEAAFGRPLSERAHLCFVEEAAEHQFRRGDSNG
jgi:molecular chaperone DnaK (HSP70)